MFMSIWEGNMYVCVCVCVRACVYSLKVQPERKEREMSSSFNIWQLFAQCILGVGCVT